MGAGVGAHSVFVGKGEVLVVTVPRRIAVLAPVGMLVVASLDTGADGGPIPHGLLVGRALRAREDLVHEVVVQDRTFGEAALQAFALFAVELLGDRRVWGCQHHGEHCRERDKRPEQFCDELCHCHVGSFVYYVYYNKKNLICQVLFGSILAYFPTLPSASASLSHLFRICSFTFSQGPYEVTIVLMPANSRMPYWISLV